MTFDPMDPFSGGLGGTPERALNTKTVDLLLRLVDSGRGLASLMSPEDSLRRTRIEGLWKWHRRAESMIMHELGRRKRALDKQRRELEELEGRPLVDDEEDEEDEDEDLGFITF